MPLKGPLLALGFAVAASMATSSPNGGAPGNASADHAWREVKWPFLLDQWGTGRAFRCGAANCGAEITVYIRPKIGFCNCATGVADDAELDRVGDIELIGERFAPLRAGRPIMVAHMNGRSRLYAVELPQRHNALALAFNDKCDVVVATVVGERNLPPDASASPSPSSTARGSCAGSRPR